MSTAPVMRLRRPRWRDPRLVVGVVLVLASVLMGALLVSRLSGTTTVLVARTAIVPGQVLTADQLTTAEVRLGEQTPQYVVAADAVPEGAVATQSVRAGELLPVAAVGQPEDVSLRPVVVPVDVAVADSVTPGSLVELWHTAEDGTGARMLVEGAVVRRVDDGSSLAMRSMTVEILVPREDLASVLDVLSREERLDVVGVPGAYGTTP